VTDQWSVLKFTTRSGTGTQDLTFSGITETPQALVLIWGSTTNEDTSETPARMGVALFSLDTNAIAGGETGGASTTLIRHAQATPAGATGAGNEDVILLCTDASSGFDIVAVLDSVIAGGVRLSFTTVASGVEIDVTAILFAGSAMRTYGGVASTTSTTPAQVDVGGAGTEFQPDLLITTSSFQGLDAAARTEIPSAGLGFVTALAQKVTHVNWRGGTEPSEVDGVVRSDRGGAGFFGLSRPECGHVFALNADGFTVAGTNTTATRSRFLAIKFGDTQQIAALNLAISGSATDQDFTTGFSPTLLIGCSSLMASQDTQTEDETASAVGYFITGPLGSRATTVREEEGLTGVSAVSGRQGDDALLTYNHLGAVAQRASWVSALATGFRLNFSTATAGHMTVLAIGPVAQLAVVSETENITESVVAFLNQTLVVSESVTISEDNEDVLLDTFDVTTSQGQEGAVLGAHAERGTCFAGGAEAGAVL
jgi:hypothetical protein